MSENSDNRANLSEEKRSRLEKFELNWEEFKNKPIAGMPCFRSTFLTSNFNYL